MIRVLAIVVLLAGTAAAGPVPTPGLTQVVHTAELTGKGTNPAPLGLNPCGSTGQTYVISGSTWGCTTVASLPSALTPGTLPMAASGTTLADSPFHYDSGTTITTSSHSLSVTGNILATNDVHSLGTSEVDGNFTAGVVSTNTQTLVGQVQLSGASQTTIFNYQPDASTRIRAGAAAGIIYVGEIGTGGIQLGNASNNTAVIGALQVSGGALNMSTHLIDNVVDPSSAQDAATKHYVDTSLTGGITGTTNDLAVFSAAHTVGNYAGSSPSACTTGQAVTTSSLSATGTLTATCTTLLAGTTNKLQKSNGSNAHVDSGITDNGTTVTTSEAVTLSGTTTVKTSLFVQDSTPTAAIRLVGASGTGFIQVGTSSATSAAPLTISSMNGGVVYASWDSSGNFSAPNNVALGASNSNTTTVLGTLFVGDGATAEYKFVSGGGSNYIESGTSTSTSAAPLNFASMNAGVLYGGFDITGNFWATGSVATGGASGSKWSRGSGVPGISCAGGDLFSRTDGSTSTTLYVCTATNTWTAK